MSDNSGIEWTTHTFNPWWGCIRVSPGCQNCYAETLAKRYGHEVWGPAQTTERRTFGAKHWLEPLRWNARARLTHQRARVFCASMADVFEDHPALTPERAALWGVIEETPWLDWQLLTKRPENITRMIPPAWLDQPRRNVWFGTSVEDQRAADERIPLLLETPAAVRFLSCEPLLGPINFRRAGGGNGYSWNALTGIHDEGPLQWASGHERIHWLIAGGESGPGARPMHPDWARSLRDQCVAAGVPFFFKQWGDWKPAPPVFDAPSFAGGRAFQSAFGATTAYPFGARGRRRRVLAGDQVMERTGKKEAGRLLDGREWSEFPEVSR